MEREHHRAVPQRARRHGQQQLLGELRGWRAGGPSGVQFSGAETLQVNHGDANVIVLCYSMLYLTYYTITTQGFGHMGVQVSSGALPGYL